MFIQVLLITLLGLTVFLASVLPVIVALEELGVWPRPN